MIIFGNKRTNDLNAIILRQRDERIAELTRERDRERREVRRLTDILLSMKRENMQQGPPNDVWEGGRYVMEDGRSPGNDAQAPQREEDDTEDLDEQAARLMAEELFDDE